MTTEDFLEIMADNADLFPEYSAMSQEQKEAVANLRIITGAAEAFRDPDGTLVGVGGISYKGVGEAWLITPKDIREHQQKRLLRTTKAVMKSICNEHNLWRVFATGKLSTNFLEHIGFETIDKTLVWSRRE